MTNRMEKKSHTRLRPFLNNDYLYSVTFWEEEEEEKKASSKRVF